MALPTHIYAQVSTYFPGTIAAGNGITATKSGNVWTISADMSGIPANSVALNRIEPVTGQRLLGREAAGAGDIEQLTVGGGIEFSGAGGIRSSAFAGDVTKPAGGTVQAIAPGAVTSDKIAAGAVTSAKIIDHAVTPAKLATQTGLTVLANITGAAAVPAASALTAVLDACIGSTQGSVLYRGASAWSALGPGTSGQYLKSNGAGADPVWSAQTGGATLMTPVNPTSSTSIDFTGIPPGTKKIKVLFSNVQTNGVKNIIVQLGSSSGIETASYSSFSTYISGVGQNVVTRTDGFVEYSTATNLGRYGFYEITLCDAWSNLWVCSHVFGHDTTNDQSTVGGGSKALVAELDRLRITTVGGADQLSAGTINVMYE